LWDFECALLRQPRLATATEGLAAEFGPTAVTAIRAFLVEEDQIIRRQAGRLLAQNVYKMVKCKMHVIAESLALARLWRRGRVRGLTIVVKLLVDV
jgi:hypothetical protein